MTRVKQTKRPMTTLESPKKKPSSSPLEARMYYLWKRATGTKGGTATR